MPDGPKKENADKEAPEPEDGGRQGLGEGVPVKLETDEHFGVNDGRHQPSLSSDLLAVATRGTQNKIAELYTLFFE